MFDSIAGIITQRQDDRLDQQQKDENIAAVSYPWRGGKAKQKVFQGYRPALIHEPDQKNHQPARFDNFNEYLFPIVLFGFPLLSQSYSPINWTMISRERGRLSKSRRTICCQVPRKIRLFSKGTVREAPRRAARTWAYPFPSPQRAS